MPIPIFILTLEGADERRKPLIDSLNARSVPFELWFGVDGREGLPETHEAMIDRNAARAKFARDLTDGEFACALSHHFIYREIIARGLSYAMILEDDAILGDHFFAFLPHYKKHNYDLLTFDHLGVRVFRWRMISFINGVSAYRLAFSPVLATGYIVSKQGAKALVDKSLPISAQADWPINIADLRSYATVPRLVDHTDHATGLSHLREERLQMERSRILPPKKAAKSVMSSTYWNERLTSTYWKRKFRKVASSRILT